MTTLWEKHKELYYIKKNKKGKLQREEIENRKYELDMATEHKKTIFDVGEQVDVLI